MAPNLAQWMSVFKTLVLWCLQRQLNAERTPSTVHLLLDIVSHVRAFAHTHKTAETQFWPVTYEAWRLKTQGTNRNVRLSGRGRWEKHAARAAQAAKCSASIHQWRPDMRAVVSPDSRHFNEPTTLIIILFKDYTNTAALQIRCNQMKEWVTLTSARFSISHLLRIFMANTLSVFLTLTTATCKKDNVGDLKNCVNHTCDSKASQRMWSMLKHRRKPDLISLKQQGECESCMMIINVLSYFIVPQTHNLESRRKNPSSSLHG